MVGPMRSTDHALERALKRPGTPYAAYRLNLTGDDCGVALVVGYTTHDESGEENGVEAHTTPLTFTAAKELRDTLNVMLAPIEEERSAPVPPPF